MPFLQDEDEEDDLSDIPPSSPHLSSRHPFLAHSAPPAGRGACPSGHSEYKQPAPVSRLGEQEAVFGDFVLQPDAADS